LTGGRSLHRKLMPDTVGSDHHQPPSLRGRANKAKADTRHRLRDLYRCLHVDLLLDGWSDLKKEAARGVDGGTWRTYGENLHAHVESLVGRLKSKRYRAKLVRRHDMPKENGKARPLGIPVIEDTRLQAAVARILTVLYEPEVLAGS
jgi:RNA-directed DNA polymerase